MALRFSANLSTMFTDKPLYERFVIAKELGFSTVEISNPYEVSPIVLAEHKGELNVDLINLYSGQSKFGCGALPLHEEEFFAGTQHSMQYFYQLNYKKLHVMSGEVMPNYSSEEHYQKLVENLKSLVSSDFLENLNIIAVIEPLCAEVCEKYFLNSFETAVQVIKDVNSEYVKLLLDVFHLHKITGDVPKYLDEYYPYAGHIQVSQDPGRKHPFSAGNIDYSYVFDYLVRKQHKDYIGLEYFPSGSTKEEFSWMAKYQ